MHIRIRQLNVEKTDYITIKVSKSSLIQDVQNIIENKTGFPCKQQKLYYRGKELRSDYRINDYELKLNDVVQLLVRDKDPPPVQELAKPAKVPATSEKYALGDQIDFLDEEHGAWFEGKVTKIAVDAAKAGSYRESDLTFEVRLDRGSESLPISVPGSALRPRSFYTYKRGELRPAMTVLVNFNTERRAERGYWYDCVVRRVNRRSVTGDVLIGRARAPLAGCYVRFPDEAMRIEGGACRNAPVAPRRIPPACGRCGDAAGAQCAACGCEACRFNETSGLLVICDECDRSYHAACLRPPALPSAEAEWYCPRCKTDAGEIVAAGGDLKPTRRRGRAADGTGVEWGKGMACVGRTVECTIVPKSHFGPIPGVRVGACWRFRMQVSEAGVHRPHIAGIHGKEAVGAFSLILSGGYEDDVDRGSEFIYTGSGGRDLSGNRRVHNEQSSDQKLKRMNLALALNCDAPVDPLAGGKAKNWRDGRPVRVVRNYKLRKYSKYAPIAGNRYDGIYKVVEYYPENGKSGFRVWRYLLRRDDSAPPPWAKGGHELPMIYPPGYLEAEADDNNKIAGKKRTGSVEHVQNKKAKVVRYKLPVNVKKLIESDEQNSNLWRECLSLVLKGEKEFLDGVQAAFMCVCCREMVFESVTTTCRHNICKQCLLRFFEQGARICPLCRSELDEKSVTVVNKILDNVLKLLFPGYETGR